MSNNSEKHSYFLDWHKPSAWYRCKRKEISTSFPVMVQNANGYGAEVRFTESYGEQISFILTEEDFNLMCDQIERLKNKKTTHGTM